MSEESIIKYCAPTLAGLKTGNLFSCSYQDRSEIGSFLKELNHRLGCKGVRFLPLLFREHRALIYAYRPSRLRLDISGREAQQLLLPRGYSTHNCSKCLARLMERLGEEAEFPHEIGLFLGYPFEDVKGFIENRAARAKCVGFWKVYGDEEKARQLFHQYEDCTRIYEKQWNAGRPLQELTVAG